MPTVGVPAHVFAHRAWKNMDAASLVSFVRNVLKFFFAALNHLCQLLEPEYQNEQEEGLF